MGALKNCADPSCSYKVRMELGRWYHVATLMEEDLMNHRPRPAPEPGAVIQGLSTSVTGYPLKQIDWTKPSGEIFIPGAECGLADPRTFTTLAAIIAQEFAKNDEMVKVETLTFPEGITLEWSPIFSSAPVVGTTGKEIDPDGVNHPSHYNQHPSGVECVDIAQHYNFNVGNAIKYLWRAGLKTTEGPAREAEVKDINKAIWYLNQELKRLSID